jgi:orotate phosphoribosyltransferase
VSPGHEPPVLTEAEVVPLFRACGALLEGHFLLTSGMHSPYYLQCARVLMEPGYELARQLGALSLFVERENGRFALRRGFALERGSRVLLAEDVVTTGLSSRECIQCVVAQGATVAAAACLINRSGGRADLGVPRVALAELDLPVYAPDQLPPELADRPAIKPGSRPAPVARP